MDRIFRAWIEEAALLNVFAVLRTLRNFQVQYFWDGTEHVDPAKESNAQATRLANNTTTLAYEFARQGKDWETELRQRAKELTLMKELGLLSEGDTSDGTVAVSGGPSATQDSNKEEKQEDANNQAA